jgi:putative ABC transport system permease protein
MALSGIAIGTVAALVVTRLLSKLLFNTRPTEPLAYLAVAVLLFATALLASYIPAHRAASVEPLEALRYE